MPLWGPAAAPAAAQRGPLWRWTLRTSARTRRRRLLMMVGGLYVIGRELRSLLGLVQCHPSHTRLQSPIYTHIHTEPATPEEDTQAPHPNDKLAVVPPPLRGVMASSLWDLLAPAGEGKGRGVEQGLAERNEVTLSLLACLFGLCRDCCACPLIFCVPPVAVCRTKWRGPSVRHATITSNRTPSSVDPHIDPQPPSESYIQRQVQIDNLEASLRDIDEEVAILRQALRDGSSLRAVRVGVGWMKGTDGLLDLRDRLLGRLRGSSVSGSIVGWFLSVLHTCDCLSPLH